MRFVFLIATLALGAACAAHAQTARAPQPPANGDVVRAADDAFGRRIGIEEVGLYSEGEVRGFDPEDYMDRKDARRMARFSQLSVAAARMAVDDSGIDLDRDIDTIVAGLGSPSGGPIVLLRGRFDPVRLERVVRDHGGQVPADYSALVALPGVGDYTASAVLAFAFSKRSTVLDTNVRRVIHRVWHGMAHPPASITATPRTPSRTIGRSPAAMPF